MRVVHTNKVLPEENYRIGYVGDGVAVASIKEAMTMFKPTLKGALKGAAVAVAVLAGTIGGAASAVPTHEYEWAWYSDATYTTQVGGRYVTCNGGRGDRWGVVTEYAVMTVGLPCETYPPYPDW